MVGGFRYVGFTSSFTRPERAKLKPIVEPLIEPPGFTGNAPGGPSRWTGKPTAFTSPPGARGTLLASGSSGELLPPPPPRPAVAVAEVPETPGLTVRHALCPGPVA